MKVGEILEKGTRVVTIFGHGIIMAWRKDWKGFCYCVKIDNNGIRPDPWLRTSSIELEEKEHGGGHE